MRVVVRVVAVFAPAVVGAMEVAVSPATAADVKVREIVVVVGTGVADVTVDL